MDIAHNLRADLLSRNTPPDLLNVLVTAFAALPEGVVEEAFLRGWVSRHTRTLEKQLWEAFHTLPPAAHPLDGNPPRLGPVRRSMTPDEVEAAIRREPDRYAVVFEGERQVARFGPAGTIAALQRPAYEVRLDVRPILAAKDALYVTNHPDAAGLTASEVIQIASLGVKVYRIVLPDGWTWEVRRPSGGWPDLEEMASVLEQAQVQAERDLQTGVGANLDVRGQLAQVWDRGHGGHEERERITNFAISRLLVRNLTYMVHWRKHRVLISLFAPDGRAVPA